MNAGESIENHPPMALIDAAEAAAAEPAWVGGKGHQLGMLRRYGLPVPDFFILPAVWSRLQHADAARELATMLNEELTRRGWLEMPLAIRSSAVGEDAASASFAGIYRSCLNVRGLSAALAAVRTVWDSLDTPAALAYRARLGLPAEAEMAAVVMPLLHAEASGIAFTCDPASGREDRMILHANRGLGESLVGGVAAGDEYLLAEDDTDLWRVQTCRIGSKSRMTVALPEGGTEHVPVPAEHAAQAVLDTAQAEALAALVWDAAQALDLVTPIYDLEWVWDGKRFWLTQARPVTRKPYCTYPALRGQPAIWTRGNTCEVMPEPLSPMDWAFSRRAVNQLLEPGWRVCGYALWPGAQRARLFDGCLYLEASMMQWEAWDAIGLVPERFNAMMGGHHPAIAVQPPGFGDRLRRIGNTLRYLFRVSALRRRGQREIRELRQTALACVQQPVPQNDAELEAALMALLPLSRRAEGLYFLQGAGGGSLSLLLDTLNRVYPGEAEAIGAALLADGEPSETAAQGYALLELARIAKPSMGPQGETGKLMQQPDFVAALTAFLTEFGHRGHYETYLRNPRWREQPELLLTQLPALASVDLVALRARQRQGAAEAWRRIRQTAPFWTRAILGRQVSEARRDSNLREAARSTLISIAAAARRLWLAAGERLVALGMLEVREDIFLLLPSEVQRAMAGQIPVAGIRARLAARAKRFAEWQEATPADWRLTGEDGLESGAQAMIGSVAQSAGDGALWRGVATGTGIARGKVRRLNHPAQGGALLPGEILLAPSTDPGWTPLFLKAGGLVVETGGYLSHGAIVAREFALPAVVNLPGILEALRDGDEVEVDGMQGTVRLVTESRSH